jgi:hypothetical protein
VIIVYESQDNQGAGEEAGSKKRQADRRAMVLKDKDKTQRDQDFYEQVGQRNFCLTVAALSTQKNIGKDRDVIVEFYLSFALGTGGWGLQKTPSQWEPVNDHVQEASPGQSKKDDNDYLFHHFV